MWVILLINDQMLFLKNWLICTIYFDFKINLIYNDHLIIAILMNLKNP